MAFQFSRKTLALTFRWSKAVLSALALAATAPSGSCAEETSQAPAANSRAAGASSGTGIPAVADLATPAQTIDHFSASDAWSMQHVGLWSEANRTLVADLLLSTNHGIGLSAWRFNLMAGFDPTVSPGTPWQWWRTGNGFVSGPNQYNWSAQPGQRWFLKAALERGIDQFIAMVYSPPTNWTRNGKVYCTDKLGTSNLKPGAETAFVQSIADILEHFRENPDLAERVNFNYIMPVNEPYWEWNGNSQEGCRYSNADLIALAKNLRLALDTRELSSEIVLAEAGDIPGLYEVRTDISGEYNAPYGDYITALDGITNILSRNLSAHSYWTDDPTNQLVQTRLKLKSRLQSRPHWRYWQSEYCILGPRGPGRDLSIRTGLDVARVIWADLAVADASAWHWWLSLSQANYKDGLLYTDFWKAGDAETLYCSKTFWAFGHWSRFVRPGWKRVAMPGFEDVFGLMGTAFAAPDHSAVVMVFVNHSGSHPVIAPTIGNLPEGKRISWWQPWITSGFPSDNLSPLPPIAPGGQIRIPANAVMTLVGKVCNPVTGALPVIGAISNHTVRAGETLRLAVRLSDADTPARLVDVSAVPDNPLLLPASQIVIEESHPTNSLTRELFVGFSGETLAQVAAAPKFPNAPRASHGLLTFEAPRDLGSKYASRLRGFVVPPQTGNYTFWISSRNASELYLSENENPSGKNRIAWVNNATEPREWTKETNQQSLAVPLEGGKRYYVEAVHVATSGGDHLAVGWQLPDGQMERPIPGSRLSPWIDPMTNSVHKVLSLQFPANRSGTTRVSLVAIDTTGLASTNSFTVTVEPVVPPGSAKLDAQVENGNLVLNWPEACLGWQLEVQTNTLHFGLSTNWMILAGSHKTNTWIGSVDPTVPSAFFRLSLP